MSDKSLSVRVREYFKKQKEAAEKRIQNDIASDEAIAGETIC